MNKKNVMVTTLKLASGYHSAATIASNAKTSISRIRELAGSVLSSKSDHLQDKDAYAFKVFSPFLYQYGHTESGADGAAFFVPEGTVHDKKDIPAGKDWYKGAWFGGNSFSELMTDAFTPEQLDRMSGEAETRKHLFAIGALIIFALSVMFLFFGKWFGLASVPSAIFLLVSALRNGIYVETVRTLKVVTAKEYVAEYGYFGWAFK